MGALPPDVRRTIAKRENDRDRELRRLQSKVAEAIKPDGASVTERKSNVY